jgi:sulfate permease, SulP family
MQQAGFYQQLGPENILDEDNAIHELFHHVIDPAICIYECERRAFLECHSLPKRTLPGGAPPIPLLPLGAEPVPGISPPALWAALHSTNPPLVVDVREPREFRESHIPGAIGLPLDQTLTRQCDLPRDGQLVLVCRSGRRSARAAIALTKQGYHDLRILEGGMLLWEQQNLLTAM